MITKTQLPEGMLDQLNEVDEQSRNVASAVSVPQTALEAAPEAPVILSRPEPMEVEEGETPKFMTKVSGSPKPHGMIYMYLFFNK